MDRQERELLDCSRLLFKQLWDWRKVTIEFDIFDANAKGTDTDIVLMQGREKNSRLIEFFRVTDLMVSGPLDLTITNLDGLQIVRIRKGITLRTHNFQVLGPDNRPLGWFLRKSGFWKYSEQFTFLDNNKTPLYSLSGNTGKGISFSFSKKQRILANIKKNLGSGLKESLIQIVKQYSADDYLVEISDTLPVGSVVRRLVLAAVIVIDYSFYTTRSRRWT